MRFQRKVKRGVIEGLKLITRSHIPGRKTPLPVSPGRWKRRCQEPLLRPPRSSSPVKSGVYIWIRKKLGDECGKPKGKLVEPLTWLNRPGGKTLRIVSPSQKRRGKEPCSGPPHIRAPSASEYILVLVKSQWKSVGKPPSMECLSPRPKIKNTDIDP